MYEISFPVRETRSSYKNKKPWLTESMKVAIKKKKELWIKKTQNIDQRILEFSTMNTNELHSALLGLPKKNTMRNYLQKVGIIVKSWRIIRDVFNKRNNITKTASFRSSEHDITDQQTIAETFNEFYVNIGPTPASKIRTGRCDPISYIMNGTRNSIFLHPVSE